jgi:hypothetical protein
MAEGPPAVEVELIPPFYVALQAALLTSRFVVQATFIASRLAALASVFLYRALFVLVYLVHELVRLATHVRAQALARQEEQEEQERSAAARERLLQQLLEQARITCDRAVQAPCLPEPSPLATLDRNPSPSPGTPEPEELQPAAQHQALHPQLRTPSPSTPEPATEAQQQQQQQPRTPPAIDKLPLPPGRQQGELLASASRQEEQMLQLSHLWQRAKERACQQQGQKRAPASAVLQDAVPYTGQRQQWAQQWWQLQHELQHKQGKEQAWRQLLTFKRRA